MLVLVFAICDWSFFVFMRGFLVSVCHPGRLITSNKIPVVHGIVIRLADGCIDIYQLLTETIFIVPNSLLPYNLEENGFMNEYYEHPRV